MDSSARMAAGLEAQFRYQPPPMTMTSAAHCCMVEVDAETGFVKILRWISAEDCGTVINPGVVEGQIAGGLAQAIGQVLPDRATAVVLQGLRDGDSGVRAAAATVAATLELQAARPRLAEMAMFDAKTGELLGAHMVGAEVTELIQGYVIGRTLETTEAELMETVFPHPTLSEMMHESVLDAYGRALHI